MGFGAFLEMKLDLIPTSLAYYLVDNFSEEVCVQL